MTGQADAPNQGNLFQALPQRLPDELFQTLFESDAVRIERIVSTGQTTPEGGWYDQTTVEWVVLLRGAAELLFEGEAQPRRLGPGDHMLIPAHCRHRVTWTDPNQPTVWLAVHVGPTSAGPTAAG